MEDTRKTVLAGNGEKDVPRAVYDGVLTIDVDAQVESMEEQEEARWHQLLNAHRTRKILPYCDEQFDEYRDNSVQELRFVLSQGIREQIFYASFVKNIEKHIKSNHTINALKQLIRYQGYHL